MNKANDNTVEQVTNLIVSESESSYDEDRSESARKSDTKKRISNRGEIFFGHPKQRWFLIFGDIFVLTLAHCLASLIRFGEPVDPVFFYTWVIFVTLFVYPTALYIFDLYNLSRLFRSVETLLRSAFAICAGGIVSIFIFYLVPYGWYGRGIMAIHMVITWILLNGWRLTYSAFFQPAMAKIPVLVLGAGQSGRALHELLKSRFSPYDVKGFVDDNPQKIGISFSPRVLGTCDQLEEIAQEVGVDRAIMAIPRNRPLSLIRNILHARLKGIEIEDMPNVVERLTGRIPVQNIADQWLLFADGFYLLHKEYVRKVKRLMDMVVAAIVLAVTSPLLGLVAIAIRLDSPGPVLYTQERIGKGNQTFTIYKFRSMQHNAEKDGARWASHKDPRVTRVGKWLRLTHIDELPQIWNIFKGDMSFVGPRPERSEFGTMLEEKVPYYFVRHSVQPGLTGWAQINYQYGDSVDDAIHKLEFDLYYLKNMSILLDLKIILRTIGVVLLREGAR